MAKSSSNKFKKRRSKTFSTINVTPLLDVLIVLLVIFMTTAQMIHEDINLNLPRATSQENSKSSVDNSMKVYINSKQEVSIGEDKVENFEVYLASIDSRNKPENVVVIGDSSVPYQKLVEVLVALNNFGFTKIKMAYDKK
jgi:biopolymer transport protein ExbD